MEVTEVKEEWIEDEKGRDRRREGIEEKKGLKKDSPLGLELLADDVEDVGDAVGLAVVVVDRTDLDETTPPLDELESGFESGSGDVVDVNVEAALLLLVLGEDGLGVLRLVCVKEGEERQRAYRRSGKGGRADEQLKATSTLSSSLR
jgi:hypothetical protein